MVGGSDHRKEGTQVEGDLLHIAGIFVGPYSREFFSKKIAKDPVGWEGGIFGAHFGG